MLFNILYPSSSLPLFLAGGLLVTAHGAIIKAAGDEGGFSIALTTLVIARPETPSIEDSTRFKIAVADQCIETLARGTNDLATQVPQMLAANRGQMPQILRGGQVMMPLQQVNSEGVGP